MAFILTPVPIPIWEGGWHAPPYESALFSFENSPWIVNLITNKSSHVMHVLPNGAISILDANQKLLIHSSNLKLRTESFIVGINSLIAQAELLLSTIVL